MVNTRRMESSGLAADNGSRYRTRKSTLNDDQELGSSCFTDGRDADSGESPDEEDSWSSQGKAKPLDVESQPIVSRVRELRSRFVCDERKFSQLQYRERELRSSHKRRLINERCHSLAVYSPHKMHDMLESDDDCFPSRHARRSHYSKGHLERMERRTALSLRPLIRKSYTDNSPAHCKSDSDSARELRRSTRTRRGDKNMSWLTDDTMHQMGYPNIKRYSDGDDEDSRDAQNLRNSSNPNVMDLPKRRTRHSLETTKKNNNKFDYNFEADDVHSTNDKMSSNDKPERSLRSNRGESNDKENNEDNGQKGRQRLRKSKEIEKDEDESTRDVDSKESTTIKSEESSNLKDTAQEKEEEEGSSEEIMPVRTRNTRRRPINRDSSSSSEIGPKGYSLRERCPKPDIRSMNTRTLTRNMERKGIHLRRRFTRRKMSSNSSSSDDTDDEIDLRKTNKYSKNNQHSKNEQLKSGAGGSKVIPIGPETLDPKVTFSSVGGLNGHVQCLKEMILLPMMYPEVFTRFQIQPPRGVLFHGPPGTGKTLLARALANECSFGSRKVAFFMRKGADLLSKWIGESEKQLRLLFEQAAEKKPSIIFFDELDGLAPVRSSRQDQIHASIVSTLLALMDGLDNRGEVIVIGATNRIDAIDPALRRPGRFDRELFFPLPAQHEREEIIKVHVSQWATPPNPQLISYLAESAVGYCGSDLRALCSEAVIQSFRRTYPQVYTADHKLLLNPDNVKVEKLDFLRAKSILIPASQRVSDFSGKKLTPLIEPLLSDAMKDVFQMLERTFPHGANANLAKLKLSASVRPAQMLLLGESPAHGHTTYLAPAILHAMEHIHAYTLDLTQLFREGGRSPEEACIQVFHEAKRNVPSVIYIPNIDAFLELVQDTVIAIFTAQIAQVNPNIPLLILATADSHYHNLSSQITDIFSKYRNEVYEMPLPSVENREKFFQPLIMEACLKPPRVSRSNARTPPPLPRAPTPPPEPLSQEAAQRMFEQEERTLRELRIFLRDMCKKLASNKMFFMFTKPVDIEEVPDYPQIIKQPMDLETMMTKVDFHSYECARDFLEDIELICNNALEYNPARTSADKQIRHRACSLRDYAFALIKNEMDSDFEDKCQEIACRRRQRKASVSQYLPPYINTAQDASLMNNEELELKAGDSELNKTNEQVNTTDKAASPPRKRRMGSWQRGVTKKRKRNRDRPVLVEQQEDQNDNKMSSGEESKENNPEGGVVKYEGSEDGTTSDKNSENCLNITAPLIVNCDTTSINRIETNQQSPQSNNKRRLSDLMSPSELLEDPLDFDDIDQALQENVSEVNLENKNITISLDELENVLKYAVQITDKHNLQSLLDLHFQLSRIVKKFIRTSNRSELPKELHAELLRYQKERSTQK